MIAEIEACGVENYKEMLTISQKCRYSGQRYAQKRCLWIYSL